MSENLKQILAGFTFITVFDIKGRIGYQRIVLIANQCDLNIKQAIFINDEGKFFIVTSHSSNYIFYFNMLCSLPDLQQGFSPNNKERSKNMQMSDYAVKTLFESMCMCG